MTNFDFLNESPQFQAFGSVAAAAEHLLHIDPCACVLNCRRAMELAVKWMYRVDKGLEPPGHDSLVALMNGPSFREIIGEEVFERMEFIRRLGNLAAHSEKPITTEQAELCLENLFIFLDQVAYFYAEAYHPRRFDRSLLELTEEEALSFVSGAKAPPPPLTENELVLAEELTHRRTAHQPTFVPKPLDLSNDATRKLYLDILMQEIGWCEGLDWLIE